MYSVFDENDEKVFGCSSLHAVINYITEVGVISVVTNAKTRINLVTEEYIEIDFGGPTTAHDWIMRHVPGKLLKILSCEGGCKYTYEKE